MQKLLLIYIAISVFTLSSPLAQAAPKISDVLKKTAGEAKYNTSGEDSTSFSAIIGNIIYPLLTLIGIIFLLLTVYAGFLWMTAKGDSSQTQKARDMLSNSLIGLIIVVGAYAITYFVIYYTTRGLLQPGTSGL